MKSSAKTFRVALRDSKWIISGVLFSLIILLIPIILVVLFKLDGVRDNLVSNYVGICTVAIAITIITIFFNLHYRRGVFHFFGLNQGRMRVVIYLSNVYVMPKGTRALVPVVNGYSGPAIVNKEYQQALEVRSLLVDKRIIVAPLGFDKLVNQLVNWKEPNVKIAVSPGKDEQIHLEDGDIIFAIGGPVYNSVTKHYLGDYYLRNKAKYHRFPYFLPDHALIEENHQRAIAWHHPNPSSPDIGNRDPEPALVIRFRDVEKPGRIVFICAGVREEATIASVKYLLENWRELPLDKDFGCRLFCNSQRFSGMIFHDISEIQSATAPDSYWLLSETTKAPGGI